METAEQTICEDCGLNYRKFDIYYLRETIGGENIRLCVECISNRIKEVNKKWWEEENGIS